MSPRHTHVNYYQLSIPKLNIGERIKVVREKTKIKRSPTHGRPKKKSAGANNSRRPCNAQSQARRANSGRSRKKCKGGFKPAMRKLRRGEAVPIEAFFDKRYFEFLCLIGYERAIAEDLLPSLARTSKAKAEFMVALGISAGLLDKKAFLLEEDEVTPEKPWVHLTDDAVKVAGFPDSFRYKPTEGERRHSRGVQKVVRGCFRGKFGERYKRGHVVSERGFLERHSRLKHHIADAGIEIDGKIEILIELERSRKRKYEVVAILRKLRKLYPKAKIHYHCEPNARPVVERAVRKLRLQRWVTIYDAPKFAGLS